ncbi:unnamed protein product [Brassica rapa subsp. trilocularis]
MMTMRSVFVVLNQPPVQPVEDENEEGDEDRDNNGEMDLIVIPLMGNLD